MTRGRAQAFFDDVRSAAIDAERCVQQLQRLEEKMHDIGGGGYEPGGSIGVDKDKIGRRVAAYVDMESKLKGRREEDYNLINRACNVIYGHKQDGSGGVSRHNTLWADVLWWRFCAAAKWDDIADTLGYTVRPLQKHCAAALRWIDETGFMSNVIGE
jgi:hypothetical protein